MHDASVAASLHLHSAHMDVRIHLCAVDSLLLGHASWPKSRGLTLPPDGIVASPGSTSSSQDSFLFYTRTYEVLLKFNVPKCTVAWGFVLF